MTRVEEKWQTRILRTTKMSKAKKMKGLTMQAKGSKMNPIHP